MWNPKRLVTYTVTYIIQPAQTPDPPDPIRKASPTPLLGQDRRGSSDTPGKRAWLTGGSSFCSQADMADWRRLFLGGYT